MVVTEHDDLSSAILERTLPFLDLDLAVIEERVPSSSMRCSCGSSSTLLFVNQRAIVENIPCDAEITPVIPESMRPKPTVKRKYDEI